MLSGMGMLDGRFLKRPVRTSIHLIPRVRWWRPDLVQRGWEGLKKRLIQYKVQRRREHGPESSWSWCLNAIFHHTFHKRPISWMGPQPYSQVKKLKFTDLLELSRPQLAMSRLRLAKDLTSNPVTGKIKIAANEEEGNNKNQVMKGDTERHTWSSAAWWPSG